MGNILEKLKKTDKGFLDLRDSKILFEQALLKAKRTKTVFQFDNNDGGGLCKTNKQTNKRFYNLIKFYFISSVFFSYGRA